MTEAQLETITHLFVLAGYTAAFTVAVTAFTRTTMWSRKVSTLAIMLISVFWFGFYFWLSVRGRTHPGVTQAVLVSRIGHYFTAAGLFVMASMISRSERYGVQVVTEMSNGDG